MAFRRRLGQLAMTLLEHNLRAQEGDSQEADLRKRQEDLSRQNMGQKVLEKVFSDPAFAARARQQGMKSIAGVPIDVAIPTDAETANTVAAPIEKAKTLADLPTIEGIAQDFRGQPGSQIKPEQPAQTDPRTGLNLAKPSPIGDLMAIRQAKEKSIIAGLPNETVTGVYNPDKRITETRIVPGSEARKGQTFQTSPNPTDAGVNKGTAALAAAPGEAGAQDVMTPGLVKRAGQEAGARSAAEAPYAQPQYFTDDNNNLVALKSGPKGIQQVPGMPTGLHKGTGVKLTQSQVESVASINTAETEGVKILDALHKTGLDKSNDPMDPRWAKFVVSTLKMAPADWQKADIQQRTAFVQASVLANLVKGRPNKYIAEIYNQHVPQGNMTGQQLAHVLVNVLQQGSEKRDEYANLTGVPVKPPVGASFKQWQDLNPADANGQPDQTPLDSARAKAKALGGQ